MGEIATVGVVGAGTMGSGIAHVFARSGFNVLLCDIEQRFLDRALSQIRANLAREAAKGKLPEAGIKPVLTRIRSVTNRESLVEADFVVEAAPERFELKADIFNALDHILPEDVILATNTSSISITRLAGLTRRPQQVIGMHFFNPVPVMPLVEVVRGLATADETYLTVHELALKLGKTPVEVNDAPGFVSNRVLMPSDQRGRLCRHGGGGHTGGCRSGLQTGDGPPNGPVEPGRLHRPRCLCRYSARAAGGHRRPQVPALSSAGADGTCRVVGAQIWAGFLPIRKVAVTLSLTKGKESAL